MNKMRRMLLAVLTVALITLGGMGCGRNDDQASSEHPSGEHPTSEVPAGQEAASNLLMPSLKLKLKLNIHWNFISKLEMEGGVPLQSSRLAELRTVSYEFQLLVGLHWRNQKRSVVTLLSPETACLWG